MVFYDIKSNITNWWEICKDVYEKIQQNLLIYNKEKVNGAFNQNLNKYDGTIHYSGLYIDYKLILIKIFHHLILYQK